MREVGAEARIDEEVGAEAAMASGFDHAEALAPRPPERSPGGTGSKLQLGAGGLHTRQQGDPCAPKGPMEGPRGLAGIHGDLLHAGEPQEAAVEIGGGSEGGQHTPHVARHLVAIEVGQAGAGDGAPQSRPQVGGGEQGDAGPGPAGQAGKLAAEFQGRHHPGRFVAVHDHIEVALALAPAARVRRAKSRAGSRSVGDGGGLRQGNGEGEGQGR